MSRLKPFAIGLPILLVAGALVAGYAIFNSSSEGTVRVGKSQSTSTESRERITVTNKYASFSYPSSFTRLKNDAPIKPVLLAYNFTKQQFGSWQIGILITELQSGSLADDGTFNLRNVTPERFEKTQRTIGQHKAIIFNEPGNDSFAKVAYLQNGNVAASISFMGSKAGGVDEIQASMDEFIASWQWQ